MKECVVMGEDEVAEEQGQRVNMQAHIERR